VTTLPKEKQLFRRPCTVSVILRIYQDGSKCKTANWQYLGFTGFTHIQGLENRSCPSESH
jgi:hypothetical protein